MYANITPECQEFIRLPFGSYMIKQVVRIILILRLPPDQFIFMGWRGDLFFSRKTIVVVVNGEYRVRKE
jgi:hypothetical protein